MGVQSAHKQIAGAHAREIPLWSSWHSGTWRSPAPQPPLRLRAQLQGEPTLTATYPGCALEVGGRLVILCASPGRAVQRSRSTAPQDAAIPTGGRIEPRPDVPNLRRALTSMMLHISVVTGVVVDNYAFI